MRARVLVCGLARPRPGAALAHGGDVDAIAERLAALPTPRERAAAGDVLLAAIADAPDAARARITTIAISARRDSRSEGDRGALRAAAVAGVHDAELVAMAETVIPTSEAPRELGAALAYLASVDGTRFWALMEDPVTVRSFRDRLSTLDAFDWEIVVQELPAPPSEGVPESFAEIATARASLSVRDRAPGASDATAGRPFLFDGGWAFDRALACFATSRNASRAFAELAAIGLAGDPEVRSLSDAAALGALYRAYVLSVAGAAVDRVGSPTLPIGILTALADGDDRIGRAAAGVVLAAPDAAYAAVAAETR